MPHTARKFAKQAIPVGQFFKTVANGYYWAYEYGRDQNMDLDNSAAPRSDIDSDDLSIWGLNLAEATSDSNIEQLKDHIIYATLEQAVKNHGQLLGFFRNRSGSDRIYEDKAFRNLTNAWRDEYCLNAPVDAEPEERMKTAEWRITMCYYALYKSVSAIIRTKDSTDLSISHQKTLDKHSSQFMASRARCLYGYPFNFDPCSSQFFDFRKPFPYFIGVEDEELEARRRSQREDIYADHYKRQMEVVYSKAEKISSWDNKRNTSTFYHVFKLLREWANYEHGGIFSRLYGPGYVQFIDRGIRLLAYSAISTAEVALICAFGIDRFERELRHYQKACEEGVSEGASHIIDRYEVYQQALNDF
jgi:hypothetical protein